MEVGQATWLQHSDLEVRGGSVRVMASSVLTGTSAAQVCASVSKEVTHILVLGLPLGVWARAVVPWGGEERCDNDC
jgi:hypothetical protein